MGSADDNLSIATHERAGSLATSKASANRIKADSATRTESGQQHQVPIAQAQALIETWPEAPRKAAEKILDHYGPPNEATATKMFWYQVGGRCSPLLRRDGSGVRDGATRALCGGPALRSGRGWHRC